MLFFRNPKCKFKNPEFVKKKKNRHGRIVELSFANNFVLTLSSYLFK